MTTLDFVTVPIIVAIVYVSTIALKKSVNYNETMLRFVPLIAALLGSSLGIIAFFATPEIVPASNVWVAILIGLASGLAATGTNQVFKQITKFKLDD
jgi:hypothetical protein